MLKGSLIIVLLHNNQPVKVTAQFEAQVMTKM